MTWKEYEDKLLKALSLNDDIALPRLYELAVQTDGDAGITLEKLLLDDGCATEQQIVVAKSAVLGIPFCDLDSFVIDRKVVCRIPKEKMLQYSCIPVQYDDAYDPPRLCVVTSDSFLTDQVEEIENIVKEKVVILLSTPSAILRRIEEYCPEPKKQSAMPADVADESGKAKAIQRYDVNGEWAHSGIVKAGDYCFLSYCVGNIGGTVEEQINGAFDHMEQRLALVGLTLEDVVQMDCLFRDVYNIPVMEKVIKERFHGKYPARKSIQTNFAHIGGPDGLHFQADAVAYCGRR